MIKSPNFRFDQAINSFDQFTMVEFIKGRIFTNKYMTKKDFVESESASSWKRFLCALLTVDFLVLWF